MKTLIILLAIPTFIQTAEAKCNTRAIGVYHESGFSLSFGGGNSGAGYYDKNNVNVPLTINGQQACFRQLSKFQMRSESKGTKPMESSIAITPMKTEYENIPSPSQKQYIIVEKNADRNLTKFHTMNFVCAGEVPLSIGASSDSVIEIENPSNNRVSARFSTMIATGAAADNLREYLANPNSNVETYNYFATIFHSKSTRESDCVACNEQALHVPSILTANSVRSLSNVERSIASTFTTMNTDVPNGCSKNFAETMKNYLLENYTANETLKDYKIKKKAFSDTLLFQW
jgi:hypothetical protein